jgi:hypothetical protein
MIASVFDLILTQLAVYPDFTFEFEQFSTVLLVTMVVSTGCTGIVKAFA